MEQSGRISVAPSRSACAQGALKKHEFLPLTPCFSWVNEGHRATSTVLTVSLILRAFESILELTLCGPSTHGKKTGGLLAQAARNQTQGVEARYAGGATHSSGCMVGLFAPTLIMKAVGHTKPRLNG